MDTLTHMLRQYIGIYYKDFDWADSVFDRITRFYPQEYFAENGVSKKKRNLRITFKDGSVIVFVPAIESSKGFCFSKIIMQPGIDEDIIRHVISRTLKHQNRRMMVLQNDDDVIFL